MQGGLFGGRTSPNLYARSIPPEKSWEEVSLKELIRSDTIYWSDHSQIFSKALFVSRRWFRRVEGCRSHPGSERYPGGGGYPSIRISGSVLASAWPPLRLSPPSSSVESCVSQPVPPQPLARDFNNNTNTMNQLRPLARRLALNNTQSLRPVVLPAATRYVRSQLISQKTSN
jgi:hypothetical protein